MRIIITGSSGQLGNSVSTYFLLNDIDVYAFSRDQLDITDFTDLRRVINIIQPTHIINCAAYTDVNLAEENKDECYSINVEGTKNLALISYEDNVRLIHFSTDYVFDGNKFTGIYNEDDQPNPLNYYGYTKLLSERIITEVCSNYVIIRTSWLFGNSEKDFVSKILNKAIRNEDISVTTDEYGSPTYVRDLTKFIYKIVEENICGIYHFSNKGIVSRFEYAKAILSLANTNIKLSGLTKYVTNVKRPAKVHLTSNRLELFNRKWEEALAEYIEEKKYFNKGLNNELYRKEVSVVLAVYNGERFLENQIKSILSQLKVGDELLIIDDNSSDKSYDVIFKFKSSIIRYSKNIANLGVNKSFEIGIKLARNSIVLLSDQDDIWSEGRLVYMLDKFTKDKSIIVGNSIAIDSKGRITPFILNQTSGFINDFKNNLLSLALGSTPIYGCTMAFREELKESILPFPNYIESHDLWIGLFGILTSKIGYLDGIVLFRRVHNNNASLKKRSLYMRFKSRIIFIFMIFHAEFRIKKMIKVN